MRSATRSNSRSGHLCRSHYAFSGFYIEHGDRTRGGAIDCGSVQVVACFLEVGFCAFELELRRLHTQLSHLKCPQAGVEFLLGNSAFNKAFVSFVVLFQFEKLRFGLGYARTGGIHCGLGPVDGGLVYIWIDAQQQLSLGDGITFLNVQRDDLTTDLGGDLHFEFGLDLARGRDDLDDIGTETLSDFHLGGGFLSDPARSLGDREQNDQQGRGDQDNSEGFVFIGVRVGCCRSDRIRAS